MARTDNEIGVTTSVLDRLIDYEPEISREAIASRSKNLRQLKEALRRDLEWLLNTRQIAGGLPSDLEELNRSLAAYGVPDFTNLNVANQDDQKRIHTRSERLSGSSSRVWKVLTCPSSPRLQATVRSTFGLTQI